MTNDRSQSKLVLYLSVAGLWRRALAVLMAFFQVCIRAPSRIIAYFLDKIYGH